VCDKLGSRIIKSRSLIEIVNLVCEKKLKTLKNSCGNIWKIQH